MSNRFVQYRPLDYTPVTEPLEILKESLVNRRKLIDSMEDEQDKLALIKAQGIDGTDWQNKAVGVNKTLLDKQNEVSNYLIENSGDLYGAKRKIRELKNYVTRESIYGELGAINNATAAYSKRMEELQKEAGKKDGFSHTRINEAAELYRYKHQNLGKFDKATGTYENASSFQNPAYNYDINEQLDTAIKLTPAMKDYEVHRSKDGLTVINTVTGKESKEGLQIVKNLYDRLITDSMYKEDLNWQAQVWAMRNNVTDPEKIAQYMQAKPIFDSQAGQGYGYVTQEKPTFDTYTDQYGLEMLKHKNKKEEDQLFADQLNSPGGMQTIPINMLSGSDDVTSSGGIDISAISSDPLLYPDPNIASKTIEKYAPLVGKALLPNKTTLNGEELNLLADKIEASHSSPNFNKGHFVKWMNKTFKDPRYKDLSIHQKMERYNQDRKTFNSAQALDPYNVSGFKFESLEKRQDITKDLMSNNALDVIVVKNGKIIHGGSSVNGGTGGDFNMGDLKTKYPKDFKVDTRGDVAATVSATVPPIPDLTNDYRETISMSDGAVAYVKSNNNSINNPSREQLQLWNKLNDIRKNPTAGKDITIRGFADSEVAQELGTVYGAGVPRSTTQFKFTSKGKADNGRVAGVKYEVEALDMYGRVLGKIRGIDPITKKPTTVFNLSSPEKMLMQMSQEDVKYTHGAPKSKVDMKARKVLYYRDMTQNIK